jgi:hypothetical protein
MAGSFMKIDFAGRIQNVTLPTSRPLLPLFEAVINSIHAVEDARKAGQSAQGRIKIYIKRQTDEPRQQMIGGGFASRTIRHFIVEDDGIGFTPENYESFETSDSTLKRDRGAKGVGRFLWVKAFQEVRVTSVFGQNGGTAERSFRFSLKDNGTGDHAMHTATTTEHGTRVELLNFQEQFEKECPRKAVTIAEKIIEHCLATFLSGNAPAISLHDDDETDSVDIDAMFAETVEPHSKREPLMIKGLAFSITHLRLYSGEKLQHMIHLCANDRDVVQIPLSHAIPYLKMKLKGDTGKPFVYMAYVSGNLLDRFVNPERTGFNLPHEGELHDAGELTEEQIVRGTLESIKRELGGELQSLQGQVKTKVEDLVSNKYPEYRSLLPEIDQYIEELSRAVGNDTDLVFKLNEIQLKEDLKTRAEVEELLSEDKKPGVTVTEEYRERQRRYVKRLTEASQSRLAQYVIHRKVILEILKRRLEARPDGGYGREESIHEVVFPMQKTSNEVPWEMQNLWIIDEKLAFHRFLSSDKQLRQVGAQGAQRPDLLVLNSPGAFSDSDEVPVGSVVIVEFKRPERGDYREEDNPITQVFDYVRRLRNQKIKGICGRTIPVAEGTASYCYIICDISAKIREFAENQGWQKTPDGLGYFGFNIPLNAYAELISFDKLMQDSERRNRSLFRYLGLTQ